MMTKKKHSDSFVTIRKLQNISFYPIHIFMALRQSIQILRIRILTLSSAILLYVRLFLKTTG